jgi:hypothetical protein
MTPGWQLHLRKGEVKMSEKKGAMHAVEEGVLVIHGICTYVDIQINDARVFLRVM